MIREIYEKIRARLLELGEIKYVDLWNRNVEFIEQEEAWARPAVFIEFEPVKWDCIESGYEYHASPRVRLHIVTDWTADASEELDCRLSPDSASASTQEKRSGGSLDQLDLPVRIHGALTGLSGDCFCGLDLEESHTNHDHEDILDTVEVYSCDASRILG